MRINPLGSEYHQGRPRAVRDADVHGIVLPKAESGADVAELAHRTGNIPIHAIVTETAASLFGLLSYRDPQSPLAAMSWGAEDLSAALGATSKYDADGELGFTYNSRDPCAWPARPRRGAAGRRRLRRFPRRRGACRRAERRRGGLHRQARDPPRPGRVINAAFTPSAEDIAHAGAIVAAFEAEPDAGVLSVGGKMVDRPHLMQASAYWNDT